MMIWNPWTTCQESSECCGIQAAIICLEKVCYLHAWTSVPMKTRLGIEDESLKRHPQYKHVLCIIKGAALNSAYIEIPSLVTTTLTANPQMHQAWKVSAPALKLSVTAPAQVSLCPELPLFQRREYGSCLLPWQAFWDTVLRVHVASAWWCAPGRWAGPPHGRRPRCTAGALIDVASPFQTTEPSNDLICGMVDGLKAM